MKAESSTVLRRNVDVVNKCVTSRVFRDPSVRWRDNCTRQQDGLVSAWLVWKRYFLADSAILAKLRRHGCSVRMTQQRENMKFKSWTKNSQFLDFMIIIFGKNSTFSVQVMLYDVKIIKLSCINPILRIFFNDEFWCPFHAARPMHYAGENQPAVKCTCSSIHHAKLKGIRKCEQPGKKPSKVKWGLIKLARVRERRWSGSQNSSTMFSALKKITGKARHLWSYWTIVLFMWHKTVKDCSLFKPIVACPIYVVSLWATIHMSSYMYRPRGKFMDLFLRGWRNVNYA